MRSAVRRAAVVAGAVMVALASAAGVAAASPVPPGLAFSPSPFDYGQVTVGQAPAPTQVFTLTNAGGSASTMLTVTVAGSAAFTITADTCTGTSLGPRKSCTVTVQFAPTATGAAAATLTAAGVSKQPASAATDQLTGTGAAACCIYWTDQGTNTIGRANLDGTGANLSFITTGANEPAEVAVDGSHIYWANQNTGAIGRANLDGTGANQSFITGATFPFGVAVGA